MNATKRSVARAGLVGFSVFAVALTGCRTVVQERTVYMPAPQPEVYAPPAPAPEPPVVYVPPPEQPPVVVIQSENDFYEPLAAHGQWVVVGSYGRCWIPARVEPGWRPYSNGYWQRTDAGWYWVSDEPWGWATYHYGRWDLHAQYGWIWVPQTQWAPAWVAWREGGGYVGWAPLRPSVRIGVNVHIGDYEPAYASRAFVFVEHRRMLEPVRPKTVIVNNTTIINKTVNITNVKIVNKTVINEGPRPEVIERESGRRVNSVPAREFRHREETTVAARERNVRTSPQRNSQSSARIERRSDERIVDSPSAQVEKPAVVVTPQPQSPAPSVRRSPQPERERHERNNESEMRRNAPATPSVTASEAKPEVKPEHVVHPSREVRSAKKPAEVMTQSPQTPVTSERQSPRRPERQAPKDKKHEPEIVRNAATIPPVAKPSVKSEVKSEQVVQPSRETRLVGKPTPQSARTSPDREEKKHETTIKERTVARSPAVESRTRQEARPEVRRETNLPAKVDAAPQSAVKRQAAPASQKSADKRQMSPKTRAAEQVETNKAEKGSKKDREEKWIN